MRKSFNQLLEIFEAIVRKYLKLLIGNIFYLTNHSPLSGLKKDDHSAALGGAVVDK